MKREEGTCGEQRRKHDAWCFCASFKKLMEVNQRHDRNLWFGLSTNERVNNDFICKNKGGKVSIWRKKETLNPS